MSPEAEAAKTEENAIKDAAESRRRILTSAVLDEKDILGRGKRGGSVCCSFENRSVHLLRLESFPKLDASILETFLTPCNYLCLAAISGLLPPPGSTASPGKGAGYF